MTKNTEIFDIFWKSVRIAPCFGEPFLSWMRYVALQCGAAQNRKRCERILTKRQMLLACVALL